MIGDVAGHGADEAALGVCLRIAWRTLVLGGADVERVLPTLQQVLVHERHAEEIFATVSMVTDRRRTARRRPCAAPATRRRCCSATATAAPTIGPTATGPPLGVVRRRALARARAGARRRAGRLLLYTDGLIEGRAAAVGERPAGRWTA